MARRPKVTPPASEPGFTRVVRAIESRPVEGSRELVTVGPDHVAWRGWDGRMPIGADGAIVRVRPPGTATEEEVGRVVQNLESSGAVAVRVEWPRKSRPVVVSQAVRARARTRDVVLDLARFAQVGDPEKLVGFCESVMGKVGV